VEFKANPWRNEHEVMNVAWPGAAGDRQEEFSAGVFAAANASTTISPSTTADPGAAHFVELDLEQ